MIDDNLQILINKLAIKYKVDPKHVEYIILSFFSNMKNVMRDKTMPIVHIQHFGKFVPRQTKLEKSLRKLEAKEQMEGVSEKEKEKINNLKQVIERLENEKTFRNKQNRKKK